MQRCFDLAACGLGYVRPNPLVGAVLVKDEKIVAEGYHRKFGEAHAEVNAFKALPSYINASECTLYVNLEPCSHFGKTPPCADLVISKGVKKVVISNIDPDPRVCGKGIKTLQEHGIEVLTGVLESEGKLLNRRFFTSKIEQRPYIILKWAESFDGFIDKKRSEHETGSFQISQTDTRKLVHLWRMQEQGILVGAQTIRTDNPLLNVREAAGPSPLRFVLSTAHHIEGDYHVFSSSNPAQIIQTTNGFTELSKAMSDLYDKGLQSLLVEGGLKTLQTFIDFGLWDEIRVIRSKQSIKEGLKAPIIPINASEFDSFHYGEDFIKIYQKQ
jgi:diaminohydroxyphosphoribosylaminopyrimidine deaminase/5-amino-6-(5-phosphoribosylamino)uracil reductase